MGDYTATCDLYDRIYSFKDYKSEAEKVLEVVRRERPGANSLLDIACGTGSHHPYWSGAFLTVDGLDLEQEFVLEARRKNPKGSYFTGDMCSFRVEHKYDVITCLFSSIGYVRTYDRLVSALECITAALAPGGIALIEPWFTPDQWITPHVSVNTADGNGAKVVRMFHSSKEGNISIMRGEYLIGTASGIERRTDRHELGLFTREEMARAFAESGLSVKYDEQGLIGRGLYIARAAAPRRRKEMES